MPFQGGWGGGLQGPSRTPQTGGSDSPPRLPPRTTTAPASHLEDGGLLHARPAIREGRPPATSPPVTRPPGTAGGPSPGERRGTMTACSHPNRRYSATASPPTSPHEQHPSPCSSSPPHSCPPATRQRPSKSHAPYANSSTRAPPYGNAASHGPAPTTGEQHHPARRPAGRRPSRATSSSDRTNQFRNSICEPIGPWFVRLT